MQQSKLQKTEEKSETPKSKEGSSESTTSKFEKKSKISFRKAKSKEPSTENSPLESPKSTSNSKEEDPTSQAYKLLLKVLECGRSGSKSLERVVSVDEIARILECARNVFLSQPACVEIEGPINICGDIHGQFSDLLRIFDKAGFPHRENYLFLGDYVDRGSRSLETILLLLAYKLIFPNHFFLLRGNHECPSISKVYGFYDECSRRYGKGLDGAGVRLWGFFQTVFATLPLTAVIGEKILCMHGGISPKLQSLNDLRQFRRPLYQPDHASFEIDILWSDPSINTKGWASNHRGVSVVFGADVLRKTLDNMNIDLLVRAHQVVQDGYEFFAQRRLVTVFSAPFYCGQFDNAAAVLSVSQQLVCSFQILRPRKFSMQKRIGTPIEAE